MLDRATPSECYSPETPNNEKPFAGKTIMVTGGSSGIGAETCFEFVRQGAARIISVSRPQGAEKAKKIEKELGSMGAEVIWIYANLSDNNAPNEIIQAINASGIDRIDVLVNNAAGSNETSRFTQEEKERLLRTNYLSAVGLTRGLMGKLSSDACVINVSSTAGIWEDKSQPTYSKSKRLLINTVKAWAKGEQFKHGRRINAVVPGFVDETGMTGEIPQEAKDYVRSETPGEMATKKSVAKLITQVANPFSIANGELFIEDGGLRGKTPDVLKRAYGVAARVLVSQRKAQRLSGQS